jgi:ferredoxin like protein
MDMGNQQEKKRMTLEQKLALVKTKKDAVSHIELDQVMCSRCENKACLAICPAKTYEEINGQIHVAYENCLECGSCRLACPSAGIKWQNPRGKFGVTFLNG